MPPGLSVQFYVSITCFGPWCSVVVHSKCVFKVFRQVRHYGQWTLSLMLYTAVTIFCGLECTLTQAAFVVFSGPVVPVFPETRCPYSTGFQCNNYCRSSQTSLLREGDVRQMCRPVCGGKPSYQQLHSVTCRSFI